MATKSAQPLAQTANAVTELDGKAVEARRIRTLEDLSAAVPNLQLNNSPGREHLRLTDDPRPGQRPRLVGLGRDDPHRRRAGCSSTTPGRWS